MATKPPIKANPPGLHVAFHWATPLAAVGSLGSLGYLAFCSFLCDAAMEKTSLEPEWVRLCAFGTKHHDGVGRDLDLRITISLQLCADSGCSPHKKALDMAGSIRSSGLATLRASQSDCSVYAALSYLRFTAFSVSFEPVAFN